jgi:hypothetical protein
VTVIGTLQYRMANFDEIVYLNIVNNLEEQFQHQYNIRRRLTRQIDPFELRIEFQKVLPINQRYGSKSNKYFGSIFKSHHI